MQEADAADVDAAVAAAKAALPGWLKVSGAERGKMIWKLAELIEKNAEYLATVECLDNGLKRSLALRFVQTSANRLRYFAGFADKIHG